MANAAKNSNDAVFVEDAEIISPDEFDVEQSIAAEFNDETASYWLKAYRVGSAQGQAGIRDVYLFQCDSTEYNQLTDRLRDNYGTGNYRVKVMRKRGNEKASVIRQFDIPIEAGTKPKEPDRRDDIASGGLKIFFDAMERQQQNMEKLFEKLSEKATTAPVVNPHDQFKQMMDIFKSGMEMSNKSAVPSADTALTPERALELVSKGMELAGKAGERAESGVLDVLRDVIQSPVVTEVARAAIMQMRSRPANAPPVAPPTAEETPKPAIAHEAMPQEPTPDQLQRAMLIQLQFLLGCARDKLDPDAFAYTTCTRMDVRVRDLIVGMTDENIMQEAHAALPETAKYDDWFKEFLDRFRYYMRGGDEQEPGLTDADADKSESEPS